MDERNDYNSIPMQLNKTAMQELIKHLKENQYHIPIKINFFLENLLKKEKEQINSAFKAGMDYAEFSVPPNWNNEWEEYYNQTYNQEPKKEYQPSEKYLKKQKELMEDFIWNKMNKNNQNK